MTREKIEEAAAVMDAHLGPGLFNKKGSACPLLSVQELTSLSTTAGWEYILEKHGGRLPLRIRAVPEGTIVPNKNGEELFLPHYPH